MWNAKLDEALGGIKNVGRNISNLRYADGTILIAEIEEELKTLLIKEKEESEKNWLKACGPIISWETVETVSDFIFGGLQNHCIWWLPYEIKLKDVK